MAQQPTVLVIDDSHDTLEVLRAFLEDKGFRVLTAPDGPQGVELARRHAPQCVILDIMMPEMSGYQVCRQLRAIPDCEHLPIVILTARKAHRDASYARTVGADGFLTKPVRPAQLLAALRKHIGGTATPAGARQLGRVHLIAVTTDRTFLRGLTVAVDAHNFVGQAASRYHLADAANLADARAAIARLHPAAVIVDAKAQPEGADLIVRKLKADPNHGALPTLVVRHRKADDLKLARADARLPGQRGAKEIIAAVTRLIKG